MSSRLDAGGNPTWTLLRTVAGGKILSAARDFCSVQQIGPVHGDESAYGIHPWRPRSTNIPIAVSRIQEFSWKRGYLSG